MVKQHKALEELQEESKQVFVGLVDKLSAVDADTLNTQEENAEMLDLALKLGISSINEPFKLDISLIHEMSDMPPGLGNELLMLYLKEYACAIKGDYLAAASFRDAQARFYEKWFIDASKLVSMLDYLAKIKSGKTRPAVIYL